MSNMQRRQQAMIRRPVVVLGDAPAAAAPAPARARVKVSTDWFTYTVPFGNLAPGAVVNANLQIQQDSAFELIKLTRFGTLNGGSPPYLNTQEIECNITITDNGSGRNLINAPVPIDSIAGTGQLPFVLPQSRLFKANATIQLVVQNFSAASTYNNVSLSLCGRKIFNLPTNVDNLDDYMAEAS